MRITKSCLLAFGISLGSLISAPVRAQGPVIEPESTLPGLSALIDEALRLSPQIIMRNAEAAAVEFDVAAAKAARLPSVSSYVQWSTGQEDRQYFVDGAQRAEKLAYAVSLSQPLFHWGAISKSIESAEIRKQIDDGNTRLAYLALVRSIRSTYLRTIVSRQILQRSRLSERIASERFKDVQGKRQNNQVSEADLINAELTRDQATLNRMEAEETFDRDRTILARLVGGTLLDENAVPDAVPSIDVDSVDTVRQALMAEFRQADSPENTAIANAQKYLEISKNGLHVQRTILRPKFNLVAGMTQDEQNLTADPSTRYKLKYLYGGLSMTWSIFDGFSSRNQVRASLARMRVAEKALEEQQTALLDRLTSASKEQRRLSLMVKLEGRKLESAENYLKHMQDQVNRGQVSSADLDSAQINLFRARESAFMARYYYWNNMGELMGLIEADTVLDRLR